MTPALLDPRGQPVPAELIQHIRSSAPRGGMRAMLGNGPAANYAFPYEASAFQTPEMADWFPQVRSPDSEINLYRDRMVGRVRDLVRNDSWAAGAIESLLDSTIGASFRLVSKPDYRSLTHRFGKGFDKVWATEFAQVWEAMFRALDHDIGRYNDVSRQLTISAQLRLAWRHKLIDGEPLILRYWMPERVSRTAARFATAHLVVDPDRLSNPYQIMDTKFMRGGVELDDYGVPIAYHIRRAHQYDWYNAMESNTWNRVVREDADGFVRVIHDFEHLRAGQNRGVSIFAPVLSRLKMLATYYGVELQAATVASALGLFITSPFDQQMVSDSILSSNNNGGLSNYQDFRDAFHNKRQIMFNKVRIPTLAPGEDVKSVSVARPHGEFSPFTHEMLRSVAALTGQTASQVHKDLSEGSWSSERAGLTEAEKSFERRTIEFADGVATPLAAGFQHEAYDRGDFQAVMPRNAPNWLEARNELMRCDWLGTARGWPDPVAQRQGAVLGMDAGFGTLEQECAKQGVDWRENIAQRKAEVDAFRDAGLPLPEWMGKDLSATEISRKPEPV